MVTEVENVHSTPYRGRTNQSGQSGGRCARARGDPTPMLDIVHYMTIELMEYAITCAWGHTARQV